MKIIFSVLLSLGLIAGTTLSFSDVKNDVSKKHEQVKQIKEKNKTKAKDTLKGKCGDCPCEKKAFDDEKFDFSGGISG